MLNLPGVYTGQIAKMISIGQLPATKVGHRRMIEASDLETLAVELSGVYAAADQLGRIAQLEAEVAQLRLTLASPSDPASRGRIRAIRAEWEIAHGQRQRKNVGKRLRWLIFERDEHRCVYCGAEPADGIKLTIDHRIAFIDGGTDDPDNLATACEDCNRGKADRPLIP